MPRDSLARLDYAALANQGGHVLDSYGYAHKALGHGTNITRNLGLTNMRETPGATGETPAPVSSRSSSVAQDALEGQGILS